MKHYYLLLLFAMFLMKAEAQQSNVYTPEEYETLKSAGTLPEGNHTITYSLPDNTIVPDVNRGGPVSSCGCYIDPDGSYTLAMTPNDDGSTTLINIPFTFCLYGSNFTSLYINNNGNVSFGSPYGTFSSNPFPDATYSMVAPFWGDVDTRSGGGAVWYKITPTAIYVNWVDVGYYSQHTDKRNTFQLILTDGTDPVVEIGNNVAFCYKEMEWTTGDASNGSNGFGGVPSTVGANRGNGVDFVQFGRFDQPGGAYDGPFNNPDGIDWLDNATFKFNTCVAGSNIAPVVSAVSPSSASGSGSGIACGDTLNICGINDTLILSASFIAPENGQSITVTASAPTLTNFQILSVTPAPTATITMMVISDPSDAGFNLIDIYATDNGTPVMTTYLPISIFIDTTGISSLSPEITGSDMICPNSSVNLSTDPGYDSYLWSTGDITTNIMVADTGTYWLTVELNGCYASTTHEITSYPISIPVIQGVDTVCTGVNTQLSTTAPFVSYSWSNGTTNSTANVGVGNFTVSVTDTNGCVTTSAPFPVTLYSIPLPVVSGDQLICTYETSTISTNSNYLNYTWTGGGTNFNTNVPAGTYTVTVTDSTGCMATSLPFVISNSIPNAVITGDNLICHYDFTTLSTTNNFETYLWSNGDNTSTTTDNGGSYYVVVTDTIGCIDTSALFTVNNHAIPNADFVFTPPSGTIFENDTILFIDSSTAPGGIITDWYWTFGDQTFDVEQNPIHSYLLPGEYPVTLIITTADGCMDTVMYIYQVKPQTVVAPNIFTPNSTPGTNDFFAFQNLEFYPNSILTVFERWGNIVYESSNYQNNWDGKHYKNGKDVSDGTYYYILHITDDDGTILKGTVTILNK
jgi:gliding motility-associated-like protein